MSLPAWRSNSASIFQRSRALRYQCLHKIEATSKIRSISTTAPIVKQSTESITPLIPALKKLNLQPRHYAKVHIQDKAYIVTKGDLIHLPVRLPQTKVGDVLSLTTLSSLGSRDLTLRSKIPTRKNQKRLFLDPKLFKCQATVIEHTKVPMFTTIKKKRRNRHAKAIKSKQPYTVLRVTELQAIEEGLQA